MNENKDLAIAIARRYLERRGYGIEGSALDAEWPYGFDILAKDGDDLVFVYVKVSEADSGHLPEDALDRAEAEEDAIGWYAQQDEAPGGTFRFDTVCMKLMGSDRAILRHHINALSPDTGHEREVGA